MYLNMIKHSVFTNVTCSLVTHSSYLLLCTISGICICICTYDLAMWVWQSQLCIVNSFLMWVQSQTRSFSGKRPAAAALQLAIAILRTFIVEMFPIVVEVAWTLYCIQQSSTASNIEVLLFCNSITRAHLSL